MISEGVIALFFLRTYMPVEPLIVTFKQFEQYRIHPKGWDEWIDRDFLLSLPDTIPISIACLPEVGYIAIDKEYKVIASDWPIKLIDLPAKEQTINSLLAQLMRQ